MARYFLIHRDTGRKFEILHIDRKAAKITLRGSSGVDFEEPYDPDGFKQRDYQLRKVEIDDAEQQGIP